MTSREATTDLRGSNEPTPIITTDALVTVAADKLRDLLAIVESNEFGTGEQQQWLMDQVANTSEMLLAWHEVEHKEYKIELDIRGMCTMIKTLTRTFTAKSEEEAEEMAREEFEDDPEGYIYNSGENLIDEAAETWELYGADYEIE